MHVFNFSLITWKENNIVWEENNIAFHCFVLHIDL